MPKYKVRYNEIVTYETYVIAENEKEATELFMSGEHDNDTWEVDSRLGEIKSVKEDK